VGRPKKGRVLPGPNGRVILCKERIEKPYFLVRPQPRGPGAGSWEFTVILKERVPLVYVFVVEELKKVENERNRALQRIINEWQGTTGHSGKRPPSLELTAYIVERAFKGAWERWKIKPPFERSQCDSLFRRYVHGHPGAIRVFRAAIRQPKPWHRHHVGHELRWFLSTPGEASRHYRLLSDSPPLCTAVLQIQDL
jgi:hypothetical protein